MVTTRTMTRRRLRRAVPPAPPRRRRSRPALAGIAGKVAARGLRVSAFARVYLAAGTILAMAICYLIVAAQATQSSYELSRLKDQHSQLAAEQRQLRYREAALHTPARVEQEAAQAGLQRAAPARYVGYQPVAIDLSAPVGHDRPDDAPLWQRALAGLFGGWARDALASDR